MKLIATLYKASCFRPNESHLAWHGYVVSILVTISSVQFGLLVTSHAVFPCFTGSHGFSLRLWLTPQPRFEYGRRCHDYSTACFESVYYYKLRRNPLYNSYHIKVIIESCILWRTTNNSTENGIVKWGEFDSGLSAQNSSSLSVCIGYLCKQALRGLIHVWNVETLLVWQNKTEFLCWEVQSRSWIYRGLLLSFQASSDTRWEALSTIQTEKENMQSLLWRDLRVSGRQPVYLFVEKQGMLYGPANIFFQN